MLRLYKVQLHPHLYLLISSKVLVYKKRYTLGLFTKLKSYCFHRVRLHYSYNHTLICQRYIHNYVCLCSWYEKNKTATSICVSLFTQVKDVYVITLGFLSCILQLWNSYVTANVNLHYEVIFGKQQLFRNLTYRAVALFLIFCWQNL